MTLTGKYWRDNPGAPFATLLSTVDTYCHPDADGDAYDALKRLARRDDQPAMTLFKAELREAVLDPSALPASALITAAAYEDGSDDAFLQRLWHDLYGDEAPSASIGA